MEGSPLAILLSKEMNSMFRSLLLYPAWLLLVVYIIWNIKLSDGLDDIDDDRGLYRAQNLYEFVKGYVNSLGISWYGTDTGMRTFLSVENTRKCYARLQSSYNHDKFTNPS